MPDMILIPNQSALFARVVIAQMPRTRRPHVRPSEYLTCLDALGVSGDRIIR
jgi:hypothetical protein